MDYEKNNMLVIDARTGTVLGCYVSRDVAIDAIADARASGEWDGWCVLAEVDSDRYETEEAVEEYQDEMAETE